MIRKKSRYTVDHRSAHGIGLMPIIFVMLFTVFLIYAYLNGKVPSYIIVVYLLMSVITYMAYSYDKSYAIMKKRRISEKTLQGLTFLGGWMGALIAQQRFRHKTKKTSFLIAFWIATLLNISILIVQFELLSK